MHVQNYINSDRMVSYSYGVTTGYYELEGMNAASGHLTVIIAVPIAVVIVVSPS